MESTLNTVQCDLPTSYPVLTRHIGRRIHARRRYASRGESAALKEDIDGSSEVEDVAFFA